MSERFAQRPIMVAIAGPNGAGKSTFYATRIAPLGLRFVNADELAISLSLDAYAAAAIADRLRREMVSLGESFVFETVFSDPVGEKIAFLEEAVGKGYTVVLCFVGLNDWTQSRERVTMRVSQGGHDVPDEKLQARFPRTIANLRRAIVQLPHVLVYDNSDPRLPCRYVARFEKAVLQELREPVPTWLMPVLPKR